SPPAFLHRSEDSEERETGQRIDEKAVARYDLRDRLQAFQESCIATFLHPAGQVRAGEDLADSVVYLVSGAGKGGLAADVTKHHFRASVGKAEDRWRDARNDVGELSEADSTPVEIDRLVALKKIAASDARRGEGYDGFDIRG